MLNDVTVFNIREYLPASSDEDLGEDALQQLLSEFFCDKNPDVEKFLKEQAIDFAKKHQSVTYLVFSNDDASLIGYFALAIKPITVHTEGLDMSKSMQRRLARVSEFDEENEKLLHFYEDENGFKRFDVRKTKTNESHTLIQLLKVL